MSIYSFLYSWLSSAWPFELPSHLPLLSQYSHHMKPLSTLVTAYHKPVILWLAGYAKNTLAHILYGHLIFITRIFSLRAICLTFDTVSKYSYSLGSCFLNSALSFALPFRKTNKRLLLSNKERSLAPVQSNMQYILYLQTQCTAFEALSAAATRSQKRNFGP